MNAPLYTTKILRLAASLPAPVLLEREDGSAELRSPTCGSTIRTAVMIDEGGRIEALSQSVSACAFGQASAALIDAGAPGKTRAEIATALASLDEWLGGACDDPGNWPGVGALAPARSKAGRHAAILLPFRALLSAIEAAGQ